MFSDYRKSGILVAEKEFLMLRNTEPLEEPCDELIDTTGEICDLL